MKLTRIIGWLLPTALAVLGLCSLLVLLPAGHRDLDAPVAHLVKFAVAQGSTHFAIADFDGDLRPDLAMIRVSRYGAPQTEYSLELEFSSGTRAPIGLVGPAGGLEVYPQDVNGDQIADLVITSVMDAEFVAILVNDGKGNFRQVDRSSYPNVGKRASSRILAPADPASYQFAVAQSRNLSGEVALSGRWRRHQQDSYELTRSAAHKPKDSSTRFQSGRAPPRV